MNTSRKREGSKAKKEEAICFVSIMREKDLGLMILQYDKFGNTEMLLSKQPQIAPDCMQYDIATIFWEKLIFITPYRKDQASSVILKVFCSFGILLERKSTAKKKHAGYQGSDEFLYEVKSKPHFLAEAEKILMQALGRENLSAKCFLYLKQRSLYVSRTNAIFPFHTFPRPRCHRAEYSYRL